MTDLTPILRRVTVFQDRAQLFKDAVVSLPKGEHTLVASGLWAAVDRDTLQVGATKGRDVCILRSVQFATRRSIKDVRPERAALDDEAKDIAAKLQAVGDRVLLADEAVALYNAVLQKVSNQGPEKEFNADHGDPDKWFEILEFATDGIREHTLLKRAAEAEQKELRADQRENTMKRNKLGHSDTQIIHCDVAEIQVKMLEDAELHLQLSYVVRGPSWTPVYDLRVDSKARTMDVTYNATVKQATDESWDDVVLELSTAKAQYGASPPEARQWTLDFAAPAVDTMTLCASASSSAGALGRAESRAAPKKRIMMNQMMMRTNDEIDDEEENLPEAASARSVATQAATVTQCSTSATFAIAGLNSIKCDGEPMKCTIVQGCFKGYFRYSAVPKLSAHSYLKVECTNKTPYTMLPGATHIFSDNQYVASSDMSLVAPEEKFWTFVGIDDTMQVKRHLIHRKTTTEKGWMSKTAEVHHKYVFTAVNKKNTEEEIVIWDQLPILDNKKINLTLHTPTAEGMAAKKHPVFKIDDNQFIEWIITLKGGEEKEFMFDYSVEHPADHHVTGEQE